MSAFSPPSLDQVRKMRESAKYAKSYKVVLDGFDLVLDSARVLLIWDDDNQLLHAMMQNSDMGTVSSAPLKMITAAYDKICSITANFEGGT